MTQTQSELLSLHTTTDSTNTDKPNSNSELVYKERVEKTAFDIVGNEDNGYFIALGSYRLISPQKTIEKCRIMIQTKDWELILGLIGACMEESIPRTENLIHHILDTREPSIK